MDELQELCALRSEVPVHDDAAHARAASVLDARLRQQRPSPRRWRPRLTIPAVALAAAAVVLFTAIGIGSDPEQASAATALQHAARQLRSAPSTPLGAGQYWYVGQRGHTLAEGSLTDDSTYAAITTMTHELWIGRDGSGRIVRTDTDPQWVTPADHERWVAAGSPSLTGGGIDEQEDAGSLSFSFGDRTLSYDELRALPTDPAQLRTLVEDAAVANSWSAAWQQLDLIAELLRGAPLSAAQSAALYEVASTLPGIQLIGPAKDAMGRAGIGIAVESSGFRQELVLDPQSGQLLGELQTNLVDRNDLPAGVVTESISYVSTGVVDSTGDRP